MLKSSLVALLVWWLTRTQTSIETGHIEDEYDFVIVGGGTSGSVIANRLSEDPSVRILLLEVGGSDTADPAIKFPMEWPKLQRTSVDWNYKIEPQRYTNYMIPDRTENLPKGRVIGGTSSINAMLYIRGSRHDFDSWEDHGAIGWGWNNTEKYFRKFEGATEEGMSKNLGRDGPLKLSTRFKTPMHRLIKETGKMLGYNITDYHDEIEGISSITATAFEGVRQSASTAFLRPILPERKDRLHIVLNAHATEITFEHVGDRPKATGVIYSNNGRSRMIRARKEVLLSSGVIGSAQLLMLSGIGPVRHLQDTMVDPIVDLPGVGSNLQDHPMLLFFYHATNMSKDLVLNPAMLDDHIYEYIANGSGPWTTPVGQDTNIHLRTGADEFSASTSKRPFPDIQMLVLNAANETAVFVPPQDAQNPLSLSFFASIGLAHPKSRGKVRLKSNDPFQYPSVDPKYLRNKDDVSLFIEAIKRWEKFETSELFKDIGAKLIMPPYCKQHNQGEAPRSEDLYRCWIRNRVYTQNHHCCTAKMGAADDKMAVVDERLRVYGVSNLRVADASVMPHLTSANTQSPCYMIGEKAADMIKEDWNMMQN